MPVRPHPPLHPLAASSIVCTQGWDVRTPAVSAGLRDCGRPSLPRSGRKLPQCRCVPAVSSAPIPSPFVFSFVPNASLSVFLLGIKCLK